MITPILASDFLQKNRDNEKIKILCGMRGCGKTHLLNTFIQNLVNENRVALYVDLANPTYRNATAAQMVYLIKKNSEAKRRNYIFLDHIRQWEGYETIIDPLFREPNFNLFLAADGTAKTLSPLLTMLPGRLLIHTLYPFSYADTSPRIKVETFLSYAENSTLPLAYKAENQSAIDSAISSVLYHDVMEEETIRKPLLEKILRYLSLHIGDIVDTAELAAYAGRTGRPLLAKTLAAYLSALEKSGLLLVASAEEKKPNSAAKFPKRFRPFFPDGAIMTLFGEGENISYRYILNAIAVELWRRNGRVSAPETPAGAIDFLLETDGLQTLIQCIPTPDDANAEEKIQTLEAAPETYRKIILTLYPKKLKAAPTILKEPIPAWMGRI